MATTRSCGIRLSSEHAARLPKRRRSRSRRSSRYGHNACLHRACGCAHGRFGACQGPASLPVNGKRSAPQAETGVQTAVPIAGTPQRSSLRTFTLDLGLSPEVKAGKRSRANRGVKRPASMRPMASASPGRTRPRRRTSVSGAHHQTAAAGVVLGQPRSTVARSEGNVLSGAPQTRLEATDTDVAGCGSPQGQALFPFSAAWVAPTGEVRGE